MNTAFIIMLFCAFALFEAYNIVMFRVLGIPVSYSDTFYRYNAIRKHLGVVFPVMLVAMCALMMPAWLQLADTVTPKATFLAFFGGGGLLFVAVAPFFKEMTRDTGNALKDLIYRSFHGQGLVHTIGALTAMIASVVWAGVSPWWYICVAILVFTLVAMFSTKTAKASLTFWGEFFIFHTMIVTLVVGVATTAL